MPSIPLKWLKTAGVIGTANGERVNECGAESSCVEAFAGGDRATGETEWVVRGGRGLERWMEYESRLTHALSENKCSALCQYNRRRFPPEVMLDVIRPHPTVVYGG